MSFIEYADCFMWECNGCGLRAEFPPGNFHGCVAELKQRGWRITRDRDGDWVHQCGRCVRKESVVSVLDRKPWRSR